MLSSEIGAKKTYIRFERYHHLFKLLDAEFDRQEELSFESILALVTREGMRRGRLPFGYLVKVGLLPQIPDEELQQVYERQRQEKIIARNADTWKERPLAAFLKSQLALSQRYRDRGYVGANRRYLLRTVTVNLRAAEQFLRSLPKGFSSTFQLTQNDIDVFLLNHPGYRDAVRPFISYLRRNRRVFGDFSVPSVSRNLAEDAILPDDKYRELIRMWLHPAENRLKHALICLIMLLYVQPARKVVSLRMDQIQRTADEIKVSFSGCFIPLDRRIATLFCRYLDERRVLHCLEKEDDNPFVFPGWNFGGHLTSATITEYLGGIGVSMATIFSTGLHYAFLGGLRNPKALVTGLGVCNGTAGKYLEIANSRAAREAARLIRST